MIPDNAQSVSRQVPIARTSARGTARKTARVLVWMGPILLASLGRGDEPRPVISIGAVHPDRQLGELIALFRGSRAPHPAAALAAWKRANREPVRLGKPLEALIAAINPGMAGELRAIHGAEVALWFEPGNGRLVWGASLPLDDGTFSALAPAMVLSGGRAEPPLRDLAVDRLGGPGSPLMARAPGGTILAGTVPGLEVARDRATRTRRWGEAPGLRIVVEPGALGGSTSMTLRRLAEVLRPSSGSVVAHLDLMDGAASARLDVSGPRPVGARSIEPEWLNWIPSDRPMVGFALAIEPGAEAWDAAFELADRVERVDPALANVAPLRLRLGLLARTIGIRFEADVRPHLLGVSGWAGSSEKSLGSGLIAFHFDTEAAAKRVQPLDRPVGRPIRLARFSRVIAMAWGEGSLEATIAARDDPGQSAGQVLREPWKREPPSLFVGGIWPSRVPGLLPSGSTIARALAGAPPIVWSGARDLPGSIRFRVRWDDLETSVGRFLDLLPLNPPPDR